MYLIKQNKELTRFTFKIIFCTDFYTEIYYAAKTIKKLHIQSDLNSGYIHKFYHDKKGHFIEMFYQYHLPILKYIDCPALIQ